MNCERVTGRGYQCVERATFQVKTSTDPTIRDNAYHACGMHLASLIKSLRKPYDAPVFVTVIEP